MRAADWGFLLSQGIIAWLVGNLWSIDDAAAGLSGLLRVNYLWLLAMAQIGGLAAGFWQGRSGSSALIRPLLCGACPVALVAWWIAAADDAARILIVLPAAAIAVAFLGPSVAAVAMGARFRTARAAR